VQGDLYPGYKQNATLFCVHPVDNWLNFRCTAAAFNPRNVAYDATPGGAVVVIDNTTYNVENRLFGWLGVV
jgi:hypothetical protein